MATGFRGAVCGRYRAHDELPNQIPKVADGKRQSLWIECCRPRRDSCRTGQTIARHVGAVIDWAVGLGRGATTWLLK